MIHFKISGQRMMADTPIIVAGTYNYLTAEFTFSADWTATQKIAHFGLGDELHDIELHDDKIAEADGLNLPAGDWSVSVTGWIIDDGAVTKQITTSSCIVRVVGKNPGFAPIEPSLAERIAAEAMEARTGAEEARRAAEAARDEVQENAAEIVRRAQETVAKTIAADLTTAETALEQAKVTAIEDVAAAAKSQRENIAAEGTRQINAVKTAGDTAAEKSKTAQTAAEEARDAAAASATEAAQSAQTATDKAQEIADSAGQIEQNKTDIAALRTDVTGLETRIDNIDDVIIETVEPLQKQADRTDRSLNALWKLNEGQTYDIEQKEESGMNEAPSGAKYMTPEKIYGKTEQVQTNGYQLLDYEKWKNVGINGGTGVFENNGVTITATSTDAYTNFRSPAARESAIPVTPGETITISWQVDRKLNGLVYIFPNGEIDGMVNANILNADHLTYTVPDGVDNIMFRVGLKVIDETIKYSNIMIERGTVVHDWEPYTGGIPAPNPDFPEPIHSVEEIHMKHTGKNLLNFNLFNKPKGYNGITVNSTGDGGYHIYGTSTGYVSIAAMGDYSFIDVLFTLQPGTYTLSKGGVLYSRKDAESVYSRKGTFTLTEPYNVTCVMAFGLYNIGTTVDVYVYPQLEVGSTETEFENYREETRTIIPPRPLNAIGEYRDTMDIENGEWKFYSKLISETDYAHSIVCEPEYFTSSFETLTITPADLDFLRSLALTPATDHIIVTDQDGNDIPWLDEYIISLREVVSNG